MNHKRRRPKNRRAGCLLCKPHKANGAKGREASLPARERRALARARSELRDARVAGARGFRGRIQGRAAAPTG